MRTFLSFLFIFVLFFIYSFLKTVYRIENNQKKDQFAEIREMPRFSQKETIKPIIVDQETSVKKQDPVMIQEPEPNGYTIEQPEEETDDEIVGGNSDSETERYNPDSDKVAVCFSRFINCRYRDVMFNYHSDENPWSKEKDESSVECITNVKFCESGYQIISPEEESSIVNEYNQIKNQQTINEKNNATENSAF